MLDKMMDDVISMYGLESNEAITICNMCYDLDVSVIDIINYYNALMNEWR